MKTTLTFYILLIILTVWSDQVSNIAARQVAGNLIVERFLEKASINSENEIQTEAGNTLFYIFNLLPQGFILISADNALYPIPAYSWESNFIPDKIPIQFSNMLQSYKDEAEEAITQSLEANEYIRSYWEHYNRSTLEFNFEQIRSVSPLLSTTWDQGAGWNSNCPADATGPGGYCWAGCTATATAQVMKYHGHPATGEGSHSYSWPPYGTLSANFAATTYNWASMPNATSSTATQQLLYHVGVGAEMQYGPAASGAWIGGSHPASALSTLQNNFRYNPNSYYDQKAFYSGVVWDGMLKTELDNSRPLIYAGYGNGSGHSFVLDGYQGVSNNHYHVNWGWSGSYNGWFYLNSLIPYPGYDYTNDQEALFLVEPRKWKPLPDVSIDLSQLSYLGADLDFYCEVNPISYSVVTDLSTEEFSLTINPNNIMVFAANPAVTANVDIDITIRATYSGGTADDTFNFVITGATTEYDFGDAPDPSFPTLLASNGAKHTLDGATWLGAGVDGEADGQPNSTATGDDIDANGDDEDGVTISSSIVPGGTVNYTVTASTAGYLNGWIDFNVNGNWAEADEHIAADILLTPGSNSLSFSVPASAVLGNTFARFRFSTIQGILFYGAVANGEVEDYQLEIGAGESSIKWEQLPDLTPMGMDVYAASYPELGPPVILADDFLCTETGPITDIHVWGSWLADIQPDDLEFVTFSLSIHSDIPDPDEDGPEYSKPGSMLWNLTFAGDEFIAELYNVGQEGWYNPATGFYNPLGDTECWLYNFYINEEDAFIQEGTPDNPVVYWLSLQTFYEDNTARFGWKTSESHWNDDAVWFVGMDLYEAAWNELIYPFDHPFAGESVDLAFMITTSSQEEDELDFGDAPDPAYPTLLANDGARHIIDQTIYMGSLIDADLDGQPTGISSGDDNDGNDDEDGVTLANLLVPSGNGTLDIVVSNSGYLNAWSDFNQDGDWSDAGENIFNNKHMSAGDNQVNFIIPSSALSGNTNFRFRFTSYSVVTPSFTGLETDGEVEDYQFTIQELDFGDADESGTSFPTTLANDGARHIVIPNFYLGNSVDVEADGQPDGTATGDDNDGNDDEDGITFATNLIPGQQGIIDIYNTTLAGVNGYLDGWIDYNADGDWDDTGEQIFNSFALAGWPINFNTVFYNIPSGAAVNTDVFCRFRMSSTGGLPYNGLGGEGEVEDYLIFISEPFGENKIHHPQWPDTSSEGIDVYAEDPLILADDFQCIESGAITEMHIWGSWQNDIQESSLLTFEISFWSDIPDPDGDGPLYSMPGDLLWTNMFDPTSYLESIFTTVPDGEWWFNPLDQLLISQADTNIWHYKFTVPEDEAFIQYEDVIYWISVKAFDPTNPDETYNFGWKTCDPILRWNDSAVWWVNDNWLKFFYPNSHPYFTQPLGLSFYLSGVPLPPGPDDFSISIESDFVRIEWTGQAGYTYRVYSSYDPTAPFPSGWTLEAVTSNHFWQEGPPMPGYPRKFYLVVRE